MAENHSSRVPKEEEREIEEQQGEEEEEKPLSELQNCFSSNLHDRSSVEVEFRDQNSQSETTLTVPLLIPSSENDHEPDWPSLESKGQFGMLRQEILASVKSLASQDQAEKLVQDKSVCTPEVDQQNLSDLETKPVHAIVKTTSTDGYNWRKYGQKLVKGSENSRSYYRCTHVNCYAKKKVEHCDRSGCVIEILYKGRHNHEPPQKIKCPKARRFVSSVEPDGGSGTKDRPRKLSDSDPVTCKKEPRHTTLEKELYSPSECDKNDCGRVAGHDDEPDAKRRIKERNVAYSTPPFKTVKEPKIVVQAAGDVGISGDGFRWRKYGQKMVKGSPNPRSYYKCTSAGCPVRKHVEGAANDTSTIIITYEGKHDHDMPVPKKRHGPPSAALLIAAAAAMNSAQLKKSEALANRKPSKGEVTGDKALELGGEKVLESARTLLSIGIELKPY